MTYRFDLHAIASPKYIGWLEHGLLVTVGLSSLVIAAATVWGAVLAMACESGRPAVRVPVRVYQEIFRNTPLLVQLFFWYFGASQIVPEALMQWLNTPHEWALSGLRLTWPSFEFIAAALGLTLFSGAFIAEELRAGIGSVARGQRQAALALGLSDGQAMRFVVLPQAVRVALGPLFGQYLNIVKNSSLALAIGLAELSYQAREIETESFRSFEAFGVATVLYIVLIGMIAGVGSVIDARARVRGTHAAARTPFDPVLVQRFKRVN